MLRQLWLGKEGMRGWRRRVGWGGLERKSERVRVRERVSTRERERERERKRESERER